MKLALGPVAAVPVLESRAVSVISGTSVSTGCVYDFFCFISLLFQILLTFINIYPTILVA